MCHTVCVYCKFAYWKIGIWGKRCTYERRHHINGVCTDIYMHRFDKFLRRKSNIIAGRLNIIHFHVYLFIHSYPIRDIAIYIT